jgi:hypothetical protein
MHAHDGPRLARPGCSMHASHPRAAAPGAVPRRARPRRCPRRSEAEDGRLRFGPRFGFASAPASAPRSCEKVSGPALHGPAGPSGGYPACRFPPCTARLSGARRLARGPGPGPARIATRPAGAAETGCERRGVTGHGGGGQWKEVAEWSDVAGDARFTDMLQQSKSKAQVRLRPRRGLPSCTSGTCRVAVL